ncbi:MAG: primosomal protein N', partial [Naasia sp.]
EGDAVLRFDARQSGAARYTTFVDALDARPRILFGNRSVVYAPAHHLGLIAFWNDSDPLFGEPLAPYANARDVALIRAEQSGADLRFVAHTPSPAVERLVGLRWLSRVTPERIRSPRVVLTPEDPVSPRIPHSAWRAASAALEHGPVLIQVAKPGSGSLDARQRGEREAADAGSTAHDLGRAFPRVRVIRADGEHTVERIGAQPVLVIATRGAEPIAEGGYRAVLLLDGTRMLARESSRVAEDCLRWWSAASSLAADDAPVHLVGVDGDLGRALATWRLADFIDAEVAERRHLRFPPAVRVASVTGSSRLVTEAVEHAEAAGASVLLTEPLDEPGSGQVRTVIRFDYSAGAAVAGSLRTSVVAAASGRRTPRRDERGFRPPPTLRVRMDDADAL